MHADFEGVHVGFSGLPTEIQNCTLHVHGGKSYMCVCVFVCVCMCVCMERNNIGVEHRGIKAHVSYAEK